LTQIDSLNPRSACPADALNSAWPIYLRLTTVLNLDAQLQLVKTLLGFGYGDIQITNAHHPELNQFNVMFFNFIDFAKMSNSEAAVLNHLYSNLEIIKTLMQHPAALFMTEAKATPEGVHNPAAFGNFLKFLEYARDYRLISLEAVVHKMTGATAERFQIKDRVILKKSYAADITVFDGESTGDNNTPRETNKTLAGIEAAFIKGQQVLADGKLDGASFPGKVL